MESVVEKSVKLSNILSGYKRKEGLNNCPVRDKIFVAYNK